MNASAPPGVGRKDGSASRTSVRRLAHEYSLAPVSQALPAAAGRVRARVPLAIDARRAAGTLALTGVVGSGFLIAAGTAAEPSSFVPGRKGGYPWWLHEPLSSLNVGIPPEGVVVALLAMCAFYGAVLALRD